MKKKQKKILGVILFVVTVLISSCKSEPMIISDYIIENNSNHALTLIITTEEKTDSIAIENDAEYKYTEHTETSIPEPFGGGYRQDSVTILFDDNKKLVYKQSTVGKNIYDIQSYERTELETNKKRYYHNVFKYYIIPEDYQSAK